ncbi:MAG: flap endonuclease-1 [Nanoarchaeota archaeon]|nr:flap endonuclease-1 [Nanoarchaeota archaeon]
MGVKLKRIIEFKKTRVEDLKEKKLAVDAYNTIYQFLTTTRQYDGTPLKDSKGRTTSHLSGLFYRNANLIMQGVKPVYVFDGKPPFFKKQELEIRKERKEQAKKEYEQALEEKDYETARLKAAQSVYLTKEMAEESKTLIEAMGIPVIQAPSEGEAQAALLVSKEECYAVASQDYDALLFGAYKLVRNINFSGKRKLPGKNVYINVQPEIAELKEVLNTLGIDRNQLIILSMLVGTDYTEGVKGIGPVRALKIVKQEKTIENVINSLNWDERNLKMIYEFFKKPEVNENYKINFKEFNNEKVKQILVDEHDFSEKRIDSTITKLFDDKKKKSQTSLLNF